MATIVIVDDSRTIRGQLRVAMEAMGHTVIECEDGEEGAKEIIRLEPDLVVTDLNMPKVDGLMMLEIVSNALKRIRFPVFMLTTEIGTELREKGRSLGVLAWVVKPVHPTKLTEAITFALSKIKKA